MIRISKLGPVCIEVPTGYIANIFPERRVTQRRARGTWGSLKPEQQRRSKAMVGFGLGRRIGDAEAHRDRRVYIISATELNNMRRLGVARRKGDDRRVKSGAFVPCYDNPLGWPKYRRKGDDRRANHYTYKSSNDPRIVALERRGKTLTFRRYTGINGEGKS